MLRKLSACLLTALSITLSPAATAANISGDVRGVSLQYLDTGARDLPWILKNLDNPAYPDLRPKLDNLLAKYRSAGVNWIRLLVAADHLNNQWPGQSYPANAANDAAINEQIAKVNRLMEITRTGSNAGRFTIEVVLMTPRNSADLFTDPGPNYTNDWAWLQKWINGLQYNNLGMVMLGGDLSPCDEQGCEAGAASPTHASNHGAWIKKIWQYKQQQYPSLNASYEIIGVDTALTLEQRPNRFDRIRKVVPWINANTPSNPVIAAAMYVRLLPGTPWEGYRDETNLLLKAFHEIPGNAKSLWIDEFGMPTGPCYKGDLTACGTWTTQDQRNAYQGYLGASVCYYQHRYPKFAWTTGVGAAEKDPRIAGDAGRVFGLVTSYTSNTPNMRPAWSDLSLYYNLQACP